MHLSLYQAATMVAARALRQGRLGDSLAGREGAARRWRAWAAHHRRPGPLAWVHAASVGEALAVDPISRRLHTDGMQIVRTFSSPSAHGWTGLVGDHADYVPLDVRSHVATTLDALAPDVLMVSRGDLWPVLAHEAGRRGVPIVVVGGIVRAGSRRLRWPTRRLLQPTYAQVSAVDAVANHDAIRWAALGVPEGRIRVTGDPRHDTLLERIPDVTAIRKVLAWRSGAATIVAGSIEPDDETMILAAISQGGTAGARWVLVPHDPDATTVRRLASGLTALDVRAQVWAGDPIAPETRAIIVPRRGLLADLYLGADVAYVGGGFGPRGVHSVLEPASLGVPVVLGASAPADGDAALLLAAGGAIAIERAEGTTLFEACRHWLNDGDVARAGGLAARRALRGGAAAQSAELVRRLLRPS